MNNLTLAALSHAQVFLARFARDERGAALAEYAAIVIVLAIAGTSFLVVVGNQLTSAGTALNTWLNTNVTVRLGGAAL